MFPNLVFVTQEYTQATIQESLRLYPSVPLISKIAKRDTVLTVHRFTTTRSLSPSSSLPSREREHKAIEDVVPIEVIVREGNLVVLDVAGVQRNRGCSFSLFFGLGDTDEECDSYVLGKRCKPV